VGAQTRVKKKVITGVSDPHEKSVVGESWTGKKKIRGAALHVKKVKEVVLDGRISFPLQERPLCGGGEESVGIL